MPGSRSDDGALGRREAIDLALETFGGHALALQILIACATGPTAAVDVADGRRSLGVISYHFRTLHKARLLKVRRRERVRGAIKTYYTATARGEKVLRQLGLPEDASA